MTESIAPGYFSVIRSPMDISTMRAKTHRGAYASLVELERDLHLILSNAAEYNEPGGPVYEVGTAPPMTPCISPVQDY